MKLQTSTDFHSVTSTAPEELEYSRKKYRENPAQYREYCRKYAFANRDARYAQLLVHLALKSGKLTKQTCEVCGASKAEAHHDDYTKPLEVHWLCRSHHRKLHANWGAR